MILHILLGTLLVLGSQGSSQRFPSAVAALTALDQMGECKCDTDVQAYRYFIGHADESIPLLIDFTLKHKRQRYFVSLRALAQIRDERVITFLIKLAGDELLNPANMMIGDNTFNEAYPYDSDAIIGLVIELLGDYGDTRAIPIIEVSLSRLHNQHRDRDMEALRKLGKIGISGSTSLWRI